ncbi:MAG: hypothetical protein DIU80_011420 [Chloroflexota bacterium]
MTENGSDTPVPGCRTGDEPLHADGAPLPYRLHGFWQWAFSDLLAEYLVACDLGLAHSVRQEWDAVDLRTPDGVKVEVKSAAYVQSWQQARPSAISFDIRPTLGWEAATNTYGTLLQRQADVHVFALFSHRDRRTADPLNVAQWEFCVLPAAELNARMPHQKRLSFSTLLKLQPKQVRFGEIRAAIAAVLTG